LPSPLKKSLNASHPIRTQAFNLFFMKVTGISFIRNAITYDYPIVEAITSILPICDRFIVAVGQSDDATAELIQSLASDKITILPTVWDDTLRKGGKVLAVETNKALDAVDNNTDWIFYIQGDEIFHEDGLQMVRKEMKKYLHKKKVLGLVVNYLHFYGSYDYVGDSRSWYRREVRIIRNDKRIRSYRDAQGFRLEGKPLPSKLIPVYMHHYGWVKPPEIQQAKQETFNKLWHDDNWVRTNIPDVDEFDYGEIDSLKRFEGTHPKVMQPRIEAMNWHFAFDPTRRKMSFRKRVLHAVERMTGVRLGEFKNYKLVR